MFDRPRSKQDLVHREGCGVPPNGGNVPPTVETGVLLIGRGVAYRKTDLLRSKRGSCSSGGVWRTAKRDSMGYCSSPPSTSSSLHGLPSTSSSLHGLLFIQPPPRTTPPATVQPPLPGHPSIVYYSSSPPLSTVHPALHTTGSCSTTPPRAPLHRLLFIQPSTPRGPALHTTVYCSFS